METTSRKSELGSKAQHPLGTIDTLRHGLLQGLLQATISVGLLVILAATYSAIEQKMFWALPIYWVSYASILVMFIWKKAPFVLKTWIMLLVFFNLGIVNYIPDGLNGISMLFHLVTIFLAGILLGKQGSQITLAVTTTTTIIFGILYITNTLSPPTTLSSIPLEWIMSIIVFFMIGFLVSTSSNYLLPRLTTALSQSRQLTDELEKHQIALEKTIKERTASLEKRSAQLEAAAFVARESAIIQDVENLLDKTVRLISERFGFYHTGIFLLDDAKEYAILRAASSEGGQRMLKRGHRLRVGETGIVGYVTRQGEPRISLDVGVDAVYFDNPDLPATHSEMALPLRTRGQIIGALDVQSTEPEAFASEDTDALQTLADQVALAIRNTRLFQESQETLKALQRAYGESSREAWKELLADQTHKGERHDPLGVLPPPDQWSAEMKLAAQQGKAVTGETQTLAIPLKARGQVIGVINALKSQNAPPWTVEETTLMETLTDQLSIALERARSYQDTQRRAAREQLTGEITTHLRETLDIETILATAAKELRDALGIDTAEVWIEAEQPSENN
ncbi:MAG: GAF domain-containing protein [Chloroflexota bacterium]|nr:GAF domain-containing protein [Chloroflexota bacterium]